MPEKSNLYRLKKRENDQNNLKIIQVVIEFIRIGEIGKF
jgi:hypothetical protein